MYVVEGSWLHLLVDLRVANSRYVISICQRGTGGRAANATSDISYVLISLS